MISVVMPAFNAERYIAATVESVLMQTYKELELIVVDDGSTDQTKEIADCLAQKDSRILVVHQENGGTSVARNRGLDIAQGEFVAFLDADDLWEATFLEKTYQKISSDGEDFVYAFTEEIGVNGRKIPMGSGCPKEGYFDVFLHKTGELRLPFLPYQCCAFAT